MYAAYRSLFPSRFSSLRVRRCSSSENAPPPVTARTSYVLPRWDLKYFSCADVTGFRSPSPDFLTGIVLILLWVRWFSSLRRNSHGYISPRFSDCVDILLPCQRTLSQPIAFGLVVPDVTPKITCAREHLKYVTCSKQFYSLKIIWAYNQYVLGRFGVITLYRAFA